MKRLPPAFYFFLLFLVPTRASAAPGSTGVERFGSSVVDFLTGPLGLIVVAIGIVMGAYSIIMGSRDGLQRTILVITGGVLLFSAKSIVKFIADSSH